MHHNVIDRNSFQQCLCCARRAGVEGGLILEAGNKQHDLLDKVGDPIGADGHSFVLGMTNERRVKPGGALGVCYCTIATLGTMAIFSEGFHWAE